MVFEIPVQCESVKSPYSLAFLLFQFLEYFSKRFALIGIEIVACSAWVLKFLPQVFDSI